MEPVRCDLGVVWLRDVGIGLQSPQHPPAPFRVDGSLMRHGVDSARGDAFDLHTVHMVALLQVMVSRAATTLRQATMHETTTVDTGDYHQESTKLHTYLQAFLASNANTNAYAVTSTPSVPRDSYPTPSTSAFTSAFACVFVR